MNHTVRPALSDEEWREGTTANGHVGIWGDHGGPNEVWTNGDRGVFKLPDDDRHGAAALCLAGQPYGFTWADVDALDRAAEATIGTGDLASTLAMLSSRIAALLPPRRAP